MIGKVLKGLYKIYDRIATGGFATVYLGRNTYTNEIVAIKVLSEQYTREERYVERFRREAVMAQRLRHPNIVRVLDHGFEGDKHFLVMEFVEGLTLETMIERNGALSIEDVVSYSRQACDALQAANEAGIIHRDIKPANLMITPGGTLKIMDFGIARVESLAGLTQSGMFMGTPRYISPEIAQGAKADIRSDLYAFGLVMYEMLTGAPPFDGASPWAVLRQQIEAVPTPLDQMRSDVPAWLKEAVTRLLSKDPEQRFQTPADLNAVLEAHGAGVPARQDRATPVPARPADSGTPPAVPESTKGRADRARPTGLFIGLAAAVLVVAALGVALAFGVFGGGKETGPARTVVVTGAPSETGQVDATIVAHATETGTEQATQLPKDTGVPPSTATEALPASPTETATAVPPTPTDTPTARPEPTDTDTPTIAPTATYPPTTVPTPTPTPSPRATNTPKPTDTPKPTNTATSPPAPSVAGKIAFSSGGSLYVYKAGTGDRLVGPVPNMRQPDFEPGGGSIIANGEGGGTDSLWTLNAGGGLDREQSTHPDDFRPYYNPANPSRFVFDSTRLGTGSPSLFVGDINGDDGQRNPLNHGGGVIIGGYPVWLANDIIIYAGCDYGFGGGGSNCGLFSVPSWGGVPARILAGSLNELPSDGYGTQILFTSQRDGDWEVYLVNANGSGLRNLSNSPGSQDGLGTFSPDGKLVAFVSNRGGAWAMWVVKVDGTGLTKLFGLPGPLTGPWTDERISWAP